MTVQGILQIVVLLAVLALLAKPIGTYMYRVYHGERTFLDPVLRPVERGVYRFMGVDAEQEMRWTTYALALMALNVVGFLVLFLLIVLQPYLPLNTQHFKHVPLWVAWNTAVSFTTNTNWQAYGGESTLSYLTQMWLVVQQFLSPITGVCFLLAMIRGFVRHNSETLGNFWKDFVRTLLWISIPLAVVATLVMVGLGTPQNFHAYTQVATLQGGKQTIAQGPIASMNSIMQIGDNGGGYMNMNAGTPFESPNAASLTFQMLLGFLIPIGCIYLFGLMVKDVRQGWAIFVAMALMFAVGALVVYHSEAVGNPLLAHLHLAGHANMEGKETRFGPGLSSLFENSTTTVSWGSTAAANDSLTPLGGLVMLFNMMTGEVIFGSWGVGMVGMLAFAVMAVFLAGLMVGRTPEYLGKKIQAYEVKMAVLAMIVPSFVILVFAALSVVLRSGLSGIFNHGPHGLSEVLYAFSSGVGNNGSAFGGLNAASPWYAATVGFAMLFGRYPMYLPALAMAGSLAKKQHLPASAGTFPTHGWLWIVLLVGTVIIVGALTFFPALALGPIAEQFAMQAGKVF